MRIAILLRTQEVVRHWLGSLRAMPARPAMSLLEPAHLDTIAPGLDAEEFRRDLRSGLRNEIRAVPGKHLLDARGCALAAQIAHLPTNEPARGERALLADHAADIAALVEAGCAVVEPGPIQIPRTCLLLDQLVAPAAYVPVANIFPHSEHDLRALRRHRHGLPVLPVPADHTRVNWHLPELAIAAARRLFFLPGFLVSRFATEDAVRFLRHLRHKGAPGDALLLSIELTREPATVTAAYDDASGLFAAYGRNLLVRANRELQTDFAIPQFAHATVYDAGASRLELRLVSRCHQSAELDGELFEFAAGEAITTESVRLYQLPEILGLIRAAGFTPAATWVDAQRRASLHFCIV